MILPSVKDHKTKETHSFIDGVRMNFRKLRTGLRLLCSADLPLEIMQYYEVAQRSSIKHSACSAVFPITGHCYILADGIFGRIEKVLNKLDKVVLPDEYYSILVIVEHCFVLKNFMTESKLYLSRVIKPTHSWHFRFAHCKRFILTRSLNNPASIFVQSECFYTTDVGRGRSVLKRDCTNKDLTPMVLQSGPQKKIQEAEGHQQSFV
ncbi:hypothetical protein PR048_020508 [Dryococelus australis]|uniref:Uncharacterized protein n=1 Tax=Dryococelus australis TaxID=614101 RepID=A0ABQ9H6G3_9NEOP|nr:hypothetical protein PR048_020508 [Dryococelus australis]